MPLRSLLLTVLLLAPAAVALEATFTTDPGSPEARTGTLTVTDGERPLWSATTPGLRWARGGPFSPDGRTLAVLGAFGYVQLWDVPTGQRRATLLAADAKSDKVSLASFSPDGSRLVMYAYPHELSLWDTHMSRRVRLLTPDYALSRYSADADVKFSPDGTRFVMVGAAGQATLFRTADGKKLRSLPAPRSTRDDGRVPRGSLAATFSADGQQIVVLHAGGEARLYDTVSGKLRGTATWTPDESQPAPRHWAGTLNLKGRTLYGRAPNGWTFTAHF